MELYYEQNSKCIDDYEWKRMQLGIVQMVFFFSLAKIFRFDIERERETNG